MENLQHLALVSKVRSLCIHESLAWVRASVLPCIGVVLGAGMRRVREYKRSRKAGKTAQIHMLHLPHFLLMGEGLVCGYCRRIIQQWQKCAKL